MEKGEERFLKEKGEEIWRGRPEERIYKGRVNAKFRERKISQGCERNFPGLSIVYLTESY